MNSNNPCKIYNYDLNKGLNENIFINDTKKSNLTFYWKFDIKNPYQKVEICTYNENNNSCKKLTNYNPHYYYKKNINDHFFEENEIWYYNYTDSIGKIIIINI